MTLKILLIDQDIPFLVSIKQALEGTGEFRVSLAANGAAAEDLLRDGGFDAVVADFEMPDMDVMELIRRLRRVEQAIPIVMCPQTNIHYERLHFMDVQGAIAKPYAARDLILYVRDVVRRGKPAVAQPPPKPAAEDILREFEDLENSQQGTPALSEEELFGTRLFPDQDQEGFARTRLLIGQDQQERSGTRQLPDLDQQERSGTRQLPDLDQEEPSGTRLLPDLDQEEPSGTRLLPDETPGEPGDTTLLPKGQEQEITRQLPGTDTLESLMEAHGWQVRKKARTEPLPARDEPPRQPDDTPAVPNQDLDAVRQFLATDRSAHDLSDFGEVLDAMSQASEADYDVPPDDQVFHDLVDSMRPPEQDRARRTRLEELLASIASDASSEESPASADNALDYVLDAIRRGVPPGPVSETDLDDTTIGEVMDGLFEPAFEDVLAALAGKEISAEGVDEPTYGLPAAAEGREPAPEDRFTPEEMAADQDRPAWLEAYEAEGIEPPPAPPKIVEPPVSSEDSSHYPATAALNAVTSPEKEGDLSLNALLSQIEQQLPPIQPHRPKLKPLPSWKKQGPLEPSRDVASLFDHLEGVRSETPAPDEMAEALWDQGPESFAPPFPLPPELEAPTPIEDTHPSPAIQAGAAPSEPEEAFSPDLEDRLEALETDQEWFQVLGTPQPTPDVEQAEPAAELPEPPAIAPAELSEPMELPELPEQMELLELLELPELPEPIEQQEQPAPAAELPPEIEPIAPGILTIDELYALADLPVEFMTVQQDQPAAPVVVDFEAPTDLAEPAAHGFADAGHLIPMPADMAARLFEGEVSVEQAVAEEAEAAQTAVMLTQYALESSAQATLLSRPGKRLAQAGVLPAVAMERLFYIVDAAWQTGPATSDALIRFITLPDIGEFLLYSTLVDHGLRLSMVFTASTSVRAIRRQARRLSESLDLIPETQAAAPVEPPAAQTRPSRPTDLRPPAGLHEVIVTPTAKSVPAQPDEPRVGYTCLWLPYDPGQELTGDFAADLDTWIREMAGVSRWEVHDLAVHSDYIQLSISVPQKTLPDSVITQLMQETAQRSAEAYPDQGNGDPLWTDGYYLVAPPRELTEREIARFITYQRQAQLG